MNKLYYLCIFALVLALATGGAWALDCDPCTGTATGVGNGIGITGTVLGGMSGGHFHYPVGVEAGLAAGFYDTDATQTGTTTDSVNPSGSGNGWTVTSWDNPVYPCWSNLSFVKTGTQGEVDTITVQASDNARCGSLGNDADLDTTFVVDWVDIGDINEPKNKEMFAGDCFLYSVPVYPLPHGNDTTTKHTDYVKWYRTDSANVTTPLTSSAQAIYDTQNPPQLTEVRSTCFVSGLPAGGYTIFARVEIGSYIGTTLKQTTLNILPLPSSNVEGTPCSSADSGGGCSSGSCGSSGLTPQIQFQVPVVAPPSLSSGSYGNSPTQSACDKDPCFTVIKSCGSLNWYFTSCEGGNVPFAFPQKTVNLDPSLDPFIVTLGSWTLTRYGASNASSWTYKAKAMDGTLYTYGSGPDTDEKVRITYPELQRTDYPDGSYTVLSRNNAVVTRTNYSPNSISTGSDGLTLDTTGRVVERSNEDGTKTTADYDGSSFRPAVIQTKDADNNVLSTTSYTYNDDKKLSQVNQDGKLTGYVYTKDSSDNVTDITVTNLSASPQIVTKYSYSSTATTVTRKHPTDATKDQSTVTEFFVHNNLKTYVWKTTDPLGNVTRYGIYVPTGTTVMNKVVNDDYIITSNSLLWGQPFKVVDSNGNTTSYTYNSAKGTVASITYPDNTTETYTYYNDATSNPTAYPRTVKNRRGNYTHYVRSTSTLYRVDAIKTSAPVGGVEPTNWAAITADKEYTYYPNDDSHGQGGRVATETVPNVDGTNAQVTGYLYYETVNGVEKLRDGATRTSYRYWNGSAYVDRYSYTSYDDSGKVMSTTDANNRTVFYTYDAKGRQLKTIYQASPEIADESSYTCCNLQWTKDSDGRETHYAYDDAGRVTKTWTNLPGQSETAPLVSYAYDVFGNKSAVTTYSNASTARTTAYTYDKQNRVMKIDYPADLGDEEFGYTATGNVQWKKDGGNFVTLYKYDTYYRLTAVYYNYVGSLVNIVYPQTASVTYSYLNGTSMKSTAN